MSAAGSASCAASRSRWAKFSRSRRESSRPVRNDERIVVHRPGLAAPAPREGKSMRTSLAGTLLSSLLIATALTPAGAADVTFERALNSDKEPQNWILHHGNYQGH